jgi:hypothetical protein
VFAPQLERAKRRDRAAYGAIASEYVRQFDEKWLRRSPEHMRTLLGSPDIQSLADLGTSHQVVTATRLVPFGKAEVIALVVAAITPLLPLTLTMFSADELAGRLFRLFFR